MNVLHWNISKPGSISGIGKYENELYRNLVKIAKSEGYELEVTRVQRSENKILGSTVLAWLFTYRCANADIVHATAQVIAPVVFIRRPRRLIITVHDLAPMRYPFEIRDLSEKIQWILTPKALKKIDLIIAISEFTKKELIKMLNIEEEKIRMIYQGVNHSLYRPMDKESCRKHFGLNPNKKYILYVASNLYHKRMDLAKRVFEEVRKSREDVVFIKAGYSEKLLGENILSFGWIKEDDMPKLFNSADVYLHTSEYEGFGLPILEAMACGIPVVASRRASIPEIVGKAGKLVDLDDKECVKEFAEAILQILDKNIRIDRPALERSMEFSWEKTARETLEVYTEVL
jgi:glycosyltransferase involved in cell wall biosynthesis